MRFAVLLSLLLLALPPTGQARELGGVEIPDTAQPHTDATSLTLNGAGIRRRFLFMKLYVGALYLPEPAQDAAAILAMPGAKRFSMHILQTELPAEKLVKAWVDGFEKNLEPARFRALRPRIANFNGLFPTLHKGDRVDIEIIPGRGTQVWLNDKLRGRVGGEDFARALLQVWLGEHPVDRDFKQALLGVK